MTNLPANIRFGVDVYKEMPSNLIAHHNAMRCRCGVLGHLMSGMRGHKIVVLFKCLSCGESCIGESEKELVDAYGTEGYCGSRSQRAQMYLILQLDIDRCMKQIEHKKKAELPEPEIV